MELTSRTIAAVAELDPTLLESSATRTLIELGAQFIDEVTDRYGSPDDPRWMSGTVETNVLMTYHNGGIDGHSSAGPLGDGVPRGVLLISAAMNRAAGREVIDPLLRATMFAAAAAHDHTQLCGRSLLPEGQQNDAYGDERLSADTARARCLDAGVPADVADLVALTIMATAFDPTSKAQNVDYDAGSERAILAQEITAAADLLSLTARRGPLGSLEMVCESLCLHQRGQLVQQNTRAFTAIYTPELLHAIGVCPELRSAFADGLVGQAKFFSGHRYSDSHIRQVCGAGIDDLFPGRENNVELLKIFHSLLRDHTPLEVWKVARNIAGYTTREGSSSLGIDSGLSAAALTVQSATTALSTDTVESPTPATSSDSGPVCDAGV
ncbi:hypothetical protein ACL02S_23450 [Nocardia sp. 004]|uniref:hypothetical protein n=1 Tax=Nocardia sp. 004 TaxID=3385978 RepID=UPI00399F8A78